MAKDKTDRVKEIVDKMEKATPQKSKNPKLVQKEIKKELSKDDAKEKKDEKKKESGKVKGPGIPDGTGPLSGTSKCKKDKVASIVAKVKKALSKKASSGHGSDYDRGELKDTLDFFDDLLQGKEDLDFADTDRSALVDAQKVLKDILSNN